MKRLSVFVTLVLFFGFCGTNARGDTLIFTEYSSTNLGVTLNGADFGTVTNLGPDLWDWAPPDIGKSWQILTIQNSDTYWQEPGEAGFGNWFGFGGDASFRVFSDYDFSYYGNPFVPDGATLLNHLSITYTDQTSFTWDVQFFDLGDTATVPEPTSLILLGSGIACIAAFRKRCRSSN
jgi:hypothetical protein